MSAHASAKAARHSASIAEEALSIQRGTFLLTHRPYIAVTGTVPLPSAGNTVAFQMIITNCGLVPGRILSKRVTWTQGDSPTPHVFPPSPTVTDIVYPGEQVQVPFDVPSGTSVIARLDYEDLQRDSTYYFEIEYSVLAYPPVIIRKQAS